MNKAKIFLVFLLLLMLSGCQINIPNKVNTADANRVRSQLVRNYGSDFNVTFTGSVNGQMSKFSVYDKDMDIYFTEYTRTRPVKTFTVFGIDIWKNVWDMTNYAGNARQCKLAADKYDGCEYREDICPTNNSEPYPLHSILVNIDSKDDIPDKLQQVIDLTHAGVCFTQIKLNYGEFNGKAPLSCTYFPSSSMSSAIATNTGDSFYLHIDQTTQYSYTEEEFVNITPEELERIYSEK